MIYLAVIAAAGALFSHSVAERWSLSLGGVVTIQVPDGRQVIDPERGTTRLRAVLEILRVTPGIGQLTVLDKDRTQALLEPWLGADLAATIDLPVLIDLRLRGAAELDLEGLGLRLVNAAPGTVIDDHGLWLSRVAALALAVERGGWLIVTLVGIVAMMSVIFAVLSGLSVNRDIIELLHLMGARDGYIAKRFQGHVLVTALPASVIGGACGVVTILAIAGLVADPSAVLARPMQFGALGTLDPRDWLIVVLVPLVLVLLTMVAARLSALIALRRLR